VKPKHNPERAAEAHLGAHEQRHYSTGWQGFEAGIPLAHSCGHRCGYRWSVFWTPSANALGSCYGAFGLVRAGGGAI